jgi:hypothetical protein
MKFFAQLLITIVVCFALQYFLPWWTMALGSFVISYFFGNSGLKSFGAGLLGVGLLWFAMAYYIDITTASILTDKVGKLLPLNVFLLTSLVGGLVGGFAALTGALLKSKSKVKYGAQRY